MGRTGRTVRTGAEPRASGGLAFLCGCVCGGGANLSLGGLQKMNSFGAFSVISIIVIRLFAQTGPRPNPEDMKHYWQALVPSLPSVLKESFPDCCVEPSYTPTWNGYYPVRVMQTADITGGGVPEALVYLAQG